MKDLSSFSLGRFEGPHVAGCRTIRLTDPRPGHAKAAKPPLDEEPVASGVDFPDLSIRDSEGMATRRERMEGVESKPSLQRP